MYVVEYDVCLHFFFFFQAEDGIRDAQESRGLGDVYKRQRMKPGSFSPRSACVLQMAPRFSSNARCTSPSPATVSYTHLTPADDLLCVDLGGRRIINKKTHTEHNSMNTSNVE